MSSLFIELLNGAVDAIVISADDKCAERIRQIDKEFNNELNMVKRKKAKSQVRQIVELLNGISKLEIKIEEMKRTGPELIEPLEKVIETLEKKKELLRFQKRQINKGKQKIGDSHLLF